MPRSGAPGRRALPLQAYLAALVLLFVVVGGGAVWLERTRAADDARQTAAERVQFLAELGADDLSEAIDSARTSVAGVAANPGLAALFSAATPPACNLTSSEGTHIDVVDAGGTVYCSSLPLPAAGVHAGAAWIDPSATEPIVTGPVEDGTSGKQVFVVAAPIPDLGVVAALVEVDFVVSELARRFGGPLGADFLLEATDGTTIAGTPQGGERTAGNAAVPALGWSVVTSIDRGAATAAVDDLRQRELVFFVVSIVVLLAATQLLYRSLARPIARLSSAVRAAMAGEAAVSVVKSGPAEVISLADDFARLRADVQSELARRRMAEGDAQTAAENYRTLFDRNPLPMWLQDAATGEFLDVNDAMIDRFGRARHELLGMRATELVADGAESFVASIADGDRVIRSGPWRLADAAGDVLECELTSEVVDVQGRSGRLVIAEDVTTSLRAQRLLQQGERMESLGHLAGGIAHDFNNLLTVMLNYADFAASELAAAAEAEPDRWRPVLRDVEQVGEAGRRAAALTRQLLAFAKGDTNDGGSLDIGAVITDLEPLLTRTLGEHIALELSVEEALAPVRLDRSHLEQVVVNLAVNARDAMPNGGTLSIEASHVEIDEELAAGRPDVELGRYVRLRVSDTGVGMDEAARDRAFEPFFTTKAPGTGTGLGLATVYGIVRRAGGTIHVYSEPGRGTSFSTLFPALDAAEPADEVSSRPGRHKSAGSEMVLVVEDDDGLRAAAERILLSSGYRVITAIDGSSAVDLVAEQGADIDLVLTDVVMPGMAGTELAARLRASHPDLRLLLMSGYAPPVLVSQGSIAAGATLIDKPFSAALLVQKVREALDAPAG